MNLLIPRAASVYLLQRWTVPILALIAVIGAIAIWGLHSSNMVNTAPMMLTNVVGMVAMVSAFWVSATTKWQFVNARARLLPRFAVPHLIAAGAILTLTCIAWPTLVAITLGASVLGMIAYAMACSSCFLWTMHTGQAWGTVIGLALFFSPAVSKFAPFWQSGFAQYDPIRLLFILAAYGLFALWMRSLTRLTEESDHYFIQTMAAAANSSRMEKSEARRTIARQLSKSRVTGWITDAWHNRLSGVRSETTRQRQDLLRYGFTPAPALVICLGILLMVAMIGGVNYLMFAGLSRVGSAEAGHAFLAQAAIFPLIGPAILCQFLTQRQPRLAQELMLPLTKEQFIYGLFKRMGITSLMLVSMLTTGLLATVLAVDPSMITPTSLVVVPAAILSGNLVGFGLATWGGLIRSAVLKIFSMLGGLYAAMASAGLIYSLGETLGLSYGLLCSGALAVLGLWLIRHSYRYWLRAELG